MKYVPEKADLDDDMLEDFKKVFEKFTFKEPEEDEVCVVTRVLKIIESRILAFASISLTYLFTLH